MNDIETFGCDILALLLTVLATGEPVVVPEAASIEELTALLPFRVVVPGRVRVRARTLHLRQLADVCKWKGLSVWESVKLELKHIYLFN